MVLPLSSISIALEAINSFASGLAPRCMFGETREHTGTGVSCSGDNVISWNTFAPSPPYAHRPVKGEFPGSSEKSRPAPGSYSGGGPYRICPRPDMRAYPSGGWPRQTDAQTGSLSYPWLRPVRPPIIRCSVSGRVACLVSEVSVRMSSMRGTAASCLCLLESAPRADGMPLCAGGGA